MLSNVMRGGVCWGLGFAALASAGAAHAQEAEAQDAYGAAHSKGHEALQLTLQGSLVDYVKQTVKPDKPEGSTIDPDELKTSSTSFGVLGPALGVGVGYAWDQVLFGVRANLANVDTSSPGGRDTSGTQISLLPRLEYMFNTDQTRPFIAGLVGIEHLSSTTPSAIVVQNGQLSTIGKTEDSATAFAIGAAFGVHAFLNHSVSLDPEFTLLYASGSGTVKDATEGVTDPQSQGYSLSAVRVLFSLGLSGWIDTAGAPTPPPPESVGTEAPATPAAAPGAGVEPEAKPLSADIHLPSHRRLYLQVSKDPARDSVLVRLTEPRDSFALSKCEEIAIFDNGTPIKFFVRSHGEHYVTGRLSIRALEVLANSADSAISVCADQWQLGQPSREGVQGFLTARHDLLVQTGDADAPVAPAPSPPAEAPATPPSDPSAAPAAPTGAFPPSPEAAPAAAAPAPAKPAKPSK